MPPALVSPRKHLSKILPVDGIRASIGAPNSV